MQEYAIEGVEHIQMPRVRISEATIRLTSDDGEENAIKRMSIEVSDAVTALVHDTEREEFILVRQFRYPTERYGHPFLLETVAGAVDDGETPDHAIRREIEEEIGYRVKTPIPISQFFGSCGRLSELVHVYYAMVTDADRIGEGGGEDADEHIEVVRLPIDRALAMLQNPQVMDGKLLLALQWFALSERHGPIVGERGRVE